MEYVEHGRYTFDAADAILDILCNATGRTAIILGQKYIYTAPGQSTFVRNVTKITRIGTAHAVSSCVLLLKSGEHYDSLV